MKLLGLLTLIGFGAIMVNIGHERYTPRTEPSHIRSNQEIAQLYVDGYYKNMGVQVTGASARYRLGPKSYCSVNLKGTYLNGKPMPAQWFMMFVPDDRGICFRPEEMRMMIDGAKEKISKADAAKLEADFNQMCQKIGIGTP